MEKEFNSKKDEFIYYAGKAVRAKDNGDEETYLFNLSIAQKLLEEIEGKKIEDIAEEIMQIK